MGEIQRKLERIDKELRPTREVHRSITITSPLVFAALGLIIGILAAEIFSLHVLFWFTLLLILASVSVALFFLKSHRSNTELFAYLALPVLFVSVPFGSPLFISRRQMIFET